MGMLSQKWYPVKKMGVSTVWIAVVIQKTPMGLTGTDQQTIIAMLFKLLLDHSLKPLYMLKKQMLHY